MPALDLKGCLEDSPTFRKRVNSYEESIQNLETSLKSILKLARSQVNLSSGNMESLLIMDTSFYFEIFSRKQVKGRSKRK